MATETAGPVVEFTPFPKLARLRRNVIITEKIDGTNAAVVVTEDGEVFAQSRKRLIFPGSDNFGFAQWVLEHQEELRELGPGHHFGEWYGKGIQRGYGLDEKRFALFNVTRWSAERPACCEVAPVLAVQTFSDTVVDTCLKSLRAFGSYVAPGFMNPEGIVVYHTASNMMFKVTLDNDALPKSMVE